MRKSLLFISLGVLVVMSVTFASYFVLTKFYPADEIRRMTISMSRLQTVTESSGFHWTVVDGGNDVYTTLYLTGPVRLSDPTKLEHDTTFRAVFLSKSNQYKDLSGEIRHQNGKIYLTYASPGPNVKGIDFSEKGTWVSFDSGEFPSWGSLIPNLKIPLIISSSQTSWTPEGLKKLRILLAFADVLHVKFNGVEEMVNGEKTRVIDARFDTDAIKSFLYDVIRAKEDREPTDEERVNIGILATDLEHMSVRLWIGKKDHYLYRLQAIGGFPKEHSNELTPVDVRIDFTDFNRAMDVPLPESPISFKSIYQALMHTLPTSIVVRGLAVRGSEEPSGSRRGTPPISVFTQGASIPQQTIMTASDPDGDGLDNTLESFFGSNAHNPDTDGDGVRDGTEVKRGTNPNGKGSLFGFGLGN